jgi:hypothetical protein
MVETGSDGIVRPKPLSNVRSEIVTTAAVNSASATVLGTVTSGVWQGTVISATYIDSAIARLAGPTFTGTVSITGTPPATGTSTTQVATTAFVTTADNLKANSASPTFTGTVTVPTLLLTTVDTVTAASHYMVETGSDGIVRPKTLSSVRTEIVTNDTMQSNIVSPTAAGSNGIRKITISTSAPTGGVDGDVWLVYV